MPFKDAEAQRAYMRAWHKAHPKPPKPPKPRRGRQLHYAPLEQRKKQASRTWRWNLGKYYGITEDDYYRTLSEQGGVCAICDKPPKEGKRLSVDHDHFGNRQSWLRGLLCTRCNTLIANLEHELRDRADAYLALHKKLGT